jgi:beta-glucosidase
VPSILVAWFPGQEFGNALADVLLGDEEPGGRLPCAWPADHHAGIPSTRPDGGALVYDESIHVGNRGYDRVRTQPAFCFGQGLGYTSWEYLKLTAPARLDPGEDAVVQVRLRNSGNRSGREVVQVYASRPGSQIERPARWLVGFAAVAAAAGQDITADVTLPASCFAHWDAGAHAWAVEPGIVQFAVGRSSGELHLDAEIPIGRERR